MQDTGYKERRHLYRGIQNSSPAALTDAFKRDSSLSASGETPVFAPAISEGFDHFPDLPPTVDIPQSTCLNHQGSVPAYVYLVSSGFLKLTSDRDCGQQTALGLRTTGWYVGGTSVFLNSPLTYSVTTLTACKVSRVSRLEFGSRLRQDAAMMKHFVSSVCSEINTQSAGQTIIRSKSAEQRLAQLISECSAIATVERERTALLQLLKQLELAQLISVSPEYLSRLLRRQADRIPVPGANIL
jgi:CRP-like cAMP-binding protein